MGRLQQERSVLESGKVTYRLGLYDPLDADGAIEFLDGIYCETDGDDMREVIEEYNRMAANDPAVTLCLAAFPYR